MTIRIEAVWHEELQMYRIDWCPNHRDWWSYDGTEWFDHRGCPVVDEEFFVATIHLIGGPEDGETVA